MSTIKRKPYMLKRRRVLSLFQVAKNKTESPIYIPHMNFWGRHNSLSFSLMLRILGGKGGLGKSLKEWETGQAQQKQCASY